MGFFCTLASGSSGNCALYVDGRARVLVDAGLSARRIAEGLRTLGLSPEGLTHILLTHSHSDHISGLPVLLKHTRAVVVCSEGTAARLTLPPGAQTACVEGGARFSLGGSPARAFSTPHDAEGSCGFVLGEGAACVGVCTDLGHVTGEVADSLCGCAAVLLESNHDVDMLRCGPYPAYLKARILSEHGHLCNEACAEAACYLARHGTGRFLLGHLSAENNTPDLALAATRDALSRAGQAAAVEVAPRAGLGRPVLF